MKRMIRSVLMLAFCAATVLVTACGKGGESKPEALFSHGKWKDGTYTSDFLGITVYFNPDWTITSDADLTRAQAIPDMTDESVRSAIDRTGSFTELSAAGRGGTSVSIIAENGAKTGNADENTFFTSGLESIRREIVDADCIVISVAEGKERFLGESVRCVHITMSVPEYGRMLYQRRIPFFKGDCTAVLTFTALSEDDFPVLLDLFTAVK